MTAQAAIMAELRAENAQLRKDNAYLTAMLAIDADRIKRLIAAQPILRHSRRGAA